jgi:hypothetical protein
MLRCEIEQRFLEGNVKIKIQFNGCNVSERILSSSASDIN